MGKPISLIEDGPGSFRFTFDSGRGELSGRVTVGIEGPPDNRSRADKEQAAKNQILALSSSPRRVTTDVSASHWSLLGLQSAKRAA
jgi:hypothetical protein